MRRSHVSTALVIFFGAAATGSGVAVGCSATGGSSDSGTGAGGGATSTSSTSGSGSGGGGGSGGSGSVSGSGGGFDIPDAGPEDANPDVVMNPCGTECGPVELCDGDHLGLDDDCDGFVDEGCSCAAGQAHSCFKGDPSYRNTMGCFPGTERCDESGQWGPCLGGVHATENCFAGSGPGCHPITATPFADVNLKDGTGTFSADAVAGSETWTVVCPDGVNPCPGVAGTSPPDDFKPLQSGEYTVTYTKQVAGGTTDSCTYPLIVGAPGLRVELEWEHDLGGEGVDVDLHLHKPNNTVAWTTTGSDVDCGFANCTVDDFGTSTIAWFSDTATPPDPVNWYLDPVDSKNTCFFSPRGAGNTWRAGGRGCHSPRLDIDNVFCDPTETDPNSSSFCAPENINVDFPPEKKWFRIGVHYYGSHGERYDIHPRIKIFCNGALGAELGPSGYYSPEAPVTFTPDDSSVRYWLVADVAFKRGGMCGTDECIVQPLYQDAAARTPLLTTEQAVEASFGPPYPPLP